VLVLALWIFKGKKDNQTARPEIKTITEAVYASGVIEPKDKYVLYAFSDGYIEETYVNEGDLASAGETLLRVNSDIQQTQVETSRQNLELAEINAGPNSPLLKQYAANLSAANAALTNDSVNAARYERLYSKNSASKYELDQAQTQYKTSREKYEAARAEYINAQNQVALELKNARAQLKINKLNGNYYDLTAKRSGKVYSILKENGELVKKGDPIAVLGKEGKPVITLYVIDKDISKIRAGQEILVELNSLEGRILKASVNKIYPMFDDANQSYKLEAEFTGDYPLNVVGEQAEANIIISRKDNALVIPKLYLGSDSEVTIKDGFATRTVEVKTGIVSADEAEVLSGIDENTILIKKN
jgi:multidrug efflux pump subunit AcrA (membrane-fusion protein)